MSDPSTFYEIDALLTASRRVYETIRKVLWKHYMKGRTGRWRSIRSVLTEDQIPVAFVPNCREVGRPSVASWPLIEIV